MKSRGKYFIRITAALLALCLMLSSTVSARADLFPENFNKAFEVMVYSTDTGKQFPGKFLCYEHQLYIAEETVAQITEVETIHRAEGGLMVTREKADARVVFTQEQMVREGEIVYWPYIETMTMLCLNTWYDSEEEFLKVMPGKGIWELPNDIGFMTEYALYRMEGFREPDAGFISELLDYKTARYVSMVADAGKNWMKWPKYVSQYADYELYRDAIWRITFPEMDESLASIGKATGVMDVIKFVGAVPEAHVDALQTIATNKGWEALTYGVEQYKKVSRDVGKLSSVTGLLSDLKNALQIEDMQEYWLFLSTMENINSSLVSGLSLILPEAKEASPSFGQALEETVELIGGEKSPYRLMFREVAQGTYDLVIDKALGWTIFEVGTTAANFIADASLGTQEQINATLACTTNLLIQDAAQETFGKYWKQCDRQTRYADKEVSIEKMRDCMLVYLMAGYNAWRTMEFDKDLGPSVEITAERIMGKITDLLAYDEFDFSVAKNAETSAQALTNIVFNDYVEISIYWNSEVRKTPIELEVLVSGTNSAGKAITQFENGEYYSFEYDASTGQFVNTSVLTALTRTDFTNSVYLFFIDLKGDYEIVVKFPDDWSNDSISLWDCDVTLTANWEERNIRQNIDYNDDGQMYFRIPVKAEWLVNE